MHVSLPGTCCRPPTVFVILLKLVILMCGEGTNFVALHYVISSMLLLLHLPIDQNFSLNTSFCVTIKYICVQVSLSSETT